MFTLIKLLIYLDLSHTIISEVYRVWSEKENAQ